MNTSSVILKSLARFLPVVSLVTIFATRLLAAAGDLDTTFDPGTGVDARVFAAAVQLDGKIIIGGQFTTYNGTARTRIARANTDGSLDTTFNPGTGANNTVRVTTLQADGKLLIGGDFTTYNGTARNRIARLNTDGSLDATFDPGTGANTGNMNAIAVQSDGKIMIGGTFSSFNGVSRNGIARLNADGSVDLTFDPGTGVAGSLNAMVLQSDGKIVIGGLFSSYNGTARANIARVNSDGSLDLTFDPGMGAGNSIVAMARQADGRITIGGAFITYNLITRDHLARVNTDGSLDLTFDPGAGTTPFSPLAITLQTDDKIIIVGDFATYNGTGRTRIARVNTDGSLDTTFDPGTGANAIVLTTALQPDGRIIIGGFFTNYDGIARNRIARVELANSAVWNLSPVSGDWNTGANWTTNIAPNGSYDTATFAVSNTTNVSLSANTEVKEVTFNPGASAFAITVNPSFSFIISGAGVTNNSAITQNFVTVTDGINRGTLNFINNATAGNAIISNNGGPVDSTAKGETHFLDTSSAGSATLIGGSLDFFDFGGKIFFESASTGGTAVVRLGGTSVLDISLHKPPGVTIGSLIGHTTLSFGVLLGANNLTVGSNNMNGGMNGIQDGGAGGGTGGSLTKIGSGRLVLSGPNTYTGGTTVNGGILRADTGGLGLQGSPTGSGPVIVNTGTLSGDARINGDVTIGGSGASLSPDSLHAGSATGTMKIIKSLTFSPGATYNCELDSGQSTPVADKVIVVVAVKIDGALISLTDLGTATLTPGTVFTVIDNRGSSAIKGRFSNLPNRSTVTIGSNTFQANYRGGFGSNDLTLTVVP